MTVLLRSIPRTLSHSSRLPSAILRQSSYFLREFSTFHVPVRDHGDADACDEMQLAKKSVYGFVYVHRAVLKCEGCPFVTHGFYIPVAECIVF